MLQREFIMAFLAPDKGYLPDLIKLKSTFKNIFCLESNKIIFPISEQIQDHNGLDKGNEFIL